MDQELIKNLADEIVHRQAWQNWPLYALMIALALVVGYLSYYIRAYATKRGETFATKADLDELLEQVKKTTQVAEEVKAEISHADWASREWKTLRRIKLEELLHAIYKTQEWEIRNRDARIYASETDVGSSPLPNVNLVAGLYFPDLKPFVDVFQQVHLEIQGLTLAFHQKRIEAGQDIDRVEEVVTEYQEKCSPLYRRELQSVSAIEENCRHIMTELTRA